MDTKRVEKLLEAYAKRLPEEPPLTDQDITRFRERLAEARKADGDHGEEAETEPPRRPARRPMIWPLVGVTALAAAAVIVFVFVLPSIQVPETPISLALNVQVEVSRPGTLGPEPPPVEDRGTFTVRVSANKPAFVHLIALMESGDLLVKQVAPQEEGRPVFSRRVEQEESIGEYPLWYDPEDDPDRGPLRTTHVMVVAADEPIEQRMADAVPDHIAIVSAEDALRKLEERGRHLEEELGCVVVVRAIEQPPEP